MRRPLPSALAAATALALAATAQAAAQAPPPPPSDAAPAAEAEAPSFEELQATIARMQRQVDNLGEAAAQRDKALDFLSEQVDKAAGQIKGAGQATDSLRGQSAALTDELQGARTERDRLAAEAEARGRGLGEAQRTLAALEQALADERQGKAGVQGELDRTRAQVAAVTTDLASEREGRGAAQAELGRARDQLATLLRDLEAERKGRGEAAADVELSRTQLAALRGDLDAARTGLADAGARVAGLERDLAATRAAAVAERRQLFAELTTLRGTIEALNGRLGEAATSGVRQAGLIQDLDRQLKEALAAKVEELSQYRSEFFGRLRQLLGDRPDIRVVGDRFVFQSELLFESGSATLDPEGQTSLRDLARSLREVASTIPPDIDWVLRVDGHTDRLAIRAGPFTSNWELSAARAISVVEFLTAQGIPPQRLAAAGFGEFRPLDPRDDEIAYRRNRRIEFKLTEG